MASPTLVQAPTGVYVHVPYCRHRCPYCDFYLVVGRPTPAFTDALLADWSAARELLAGVSTLESVYLGGGTPGRMAPGEVGRLLEAIHAAIPLKAGAEVTLEVNPDDVTAETLAGWRAAGVTRISLGVQALDDATLRWLGRGHSAEETLGALEAVAAAGFPTFSADIIFGAPQQPLSALDEAVRIMAGLAPHISAYCLTYEENTNLGRRVEKGRVMPLDNDVEADLYERVRDGLHRAGLRQYEVSNHARPGHAAVHNRLYWAGAPTLGLGPAAASYLRFSDGTARRWRVAPDLDAYLRGERRAVDVDEMAPALALRDRIFAGIRDLERGVDLRRLEVEHGVGVPDDVVAALEREVAAGALERVGEGRYRLTPSGALVGDRVARGVVARDDDGNRPSPLTVLPS
ncbi:MAG: radical SAM family heme chaperone HemW [Myxococcota bacterium]